MQAILDLAREEGILRVRDVTAHGIHPEYLRRLCKRGRLIRIGRGLYSLPDVEIEAHHDLAEVSKRVPAGVVCLISALRFHEIGTQMPHQVWLAIDPKAARPRFDNPPLRVVRFSGRALSEGVERHCIERVSVPVYGPAKTVADCFKYRNKIGLDVCLEALRDVITRRVASIDQLWTAAVTCRVGAVMRPYMEAMV